MGKTISQITQEETSAIPSTAWMEGETTGGVSFKARFSVWLATVLAEVFDSANMSWVADANTWTYSSADSPTFVISVDADMTGTISVGMRLRLVQTTTKYFIVTAVGAYSGGATLITVYGGTDYTLANAAIENPYYSSAKAPFGFPVARSKWTVTTTDTTTTTQSSPTQNTWYNTGTVTISLPIGEWEVKLQGLPGATDSTSTLTTCQICLSTANNSASDSTMTGQVTAGGASGTIYAFASVHLARVIAVASKTTYYVNIRTTVASVETIGLYGATQNTVIRAVCAYL